MNYKTYEEIYNATIIPGNLKGNFQNDVVYNDKKELSLSSMRFTTNPYPMKYIQAKIDYEFTAIYIQPWMEHFGHFILETLSKIWLAKEFPDVPILIPVIKEHNKSIRPWQREILDLFNIKNKIIFVTEPVTVKCLYIPFSLYRHFAYLIPDYLQELAIFEGEEIIKGKKIYLSRSKFIDSRGYINQREIEEYAEKLGYKIIIPEDIPLTSLLAELATAEKILMIEGSAVCNLALIKNLNAELEIIPRHLDNPLMRITNKINTHYLEIEREKLNDLPLEIASYKIKIPSLDFALQNKKYIPVKKYLFEDSHVTRVSQIQEDINNSHFSFLEDLQEAYHTENKQTKNALIKKAKQSFKLYLQNESDYNKEDTKSNKTITPLIKVFNTYLLAVDEKTVTYFKIQFILKHPLPYIKTGFYYILKKITSSNTRKKCKEKYFRLQEITQRLENDNISKKISNTNLCLTPF